MNTEQLSKADLFYQSLDIAFKSICEKKDFWTQLNAISNSLFALEQNLDNLDNLNGTDIYNLLLIVGIFRQKTYGLNDFNEKYQRLNEHFYNLLETHSKRR